TFPFSFVYGDQKSGDLLPGWQRDVAIQAIDGGKVYQVTLNDPTTGLVVTWKATTYFDVSAVERTILFEKRGAHDTPILEEVQALDLVAATDYHELVLFHGIGGIAAPDAFTPQESNLERGFIPRFAQPGAPDAIRLGSVGGRPSNGSLPYFNVEAN